jgi:hypothetical protein
VCHEAAGRGVVWGELIGPDWETHADLEGFISVWSPFYPDLPEVYLARGAAWIAGSGQVQRASSAASHPSGLSFYRQVDGRPMQVDQFRSSSLTDRVAAG